MSRVLYIADALMCAVVWISVSVAVIYAISITESYEPLWAFLIPAFLSFPISIKAEGVK